MADPAPNAEKRLADILPQGLKDKYGLNQPHLENFTVQDLRNIQSALGEFFGQPPGNIAYACCCCYTPLLPVLYPCCCCYGQGGIARP